jgi:hypothetical protein
MSERDIKNAVHYTAHFRKSPLEKWTTKHATISEARAAADLVAKAKRAGIPVREIVLAEDD